MKYVARKPMIVENQIVVKRTNITIEIASDIGNPCWVNNTVKPPSTIPTPPGINEIAPKIIEV